MKTSLILLVYLAHSTLGTPVNNTKKIPVDPRNDLDILVNSKLLVLDLIQNLNSAADQLMDSINTFRAGIDHQAHLFEEKIASDLSKLKKCVEENINNIATKLATASGGVQKCIEVYRILAEEMFDETVEDITSCGRDRVGEVGALVGELMNLTQSAALDARNAMPLLRVCYDKNKTNIFTLSKCLGTLAVQTELKGTTFLTQSSFMVIRINNAISTLPAALEVCAGSGFVEAGIKAAKIVIDAGGCLASSAYSAMTN